MIVLPSPISPQPFFRYRSWEKPKISAWQYLLLQLCCSLFPHPHLLWPQGGGWTKKFVCLRSCWSLISQLATKLAGLCSFIPLSFFKFYLKKNYASRYYKENALYSYNVKSMGNRWSLWDLAHSLKWVNKNKASWNTVVMFQLPVTVTEITIH